MSGGQLRPEKTILLKNSIDGKFYFSLRAQLLQAHRRMAHSTEPGQRSKHAKILSYIPDPLNLFKDNELPSCRSFPGHYHSSCSDQCFLRSSFHLFISFGNCIFFFKYTLGLSPWPTKQHSSLCIPWGEVLPNLYSENRVCARACRPRWKVWFISPGDGWGQCQPRPPLLPLMKWHLFGW